jgi:serine/threonine protein kinase
VEVQTLTMTMTPFSHYRWFWRSKRSNCDALPYDEQDIVNNHGENRAIDSMNCINGVLYRVPLQGTSRALVVKKLQNKNETVDASVDDRCQKEVNLLGSICHDNIISLKDCIRRDDFILLVYDHIENGSLHQWLHPLLLDENDRQRPPLDWPTRRAIAIGVAEGLCYLHHECNKSIVHHNINSINILLDTDLKPKIGGFDLARINLAGPDQLVPVSELTAGNIFGYTAPGETCTG